MSDKTVQLGVQFDDPGVGAEERERATQRLRTELLELDVDRVELVRGAQAPPGAKAGEGFSWGELLLKLTPSWETLATVIEAAREWLGRSGGHSITLEVDGDRIEVTGVSSEAQERLVDAWIRRHSGGDGG